MDQGEIRDDLVDLIKEGLLTNGRSAQIDLVANSTNQFIYLAEDGSHAIVTVRGPRSEGMILGGARSMAAQDSGHMMDVAESERDRARDEWAASQFDGVDGDDG